MEISISYSDLKDRAAKVTEQEGKKLRMLEDNFDPDWKSGDEPRGTMIFTDLQPAPVPSPAVRDLAAEIDALKIRVEKLEKVDVIIGL